MKITVNDKIYITDEEKRLLDYLPNDGKHYVAAMVNNRIRELNYLINKDSMIEFLDLTNTDAMNIYQATIRYVLVMAIEHIYPNSRVIFNYSVSRSIFVAVTNIGRPISYEILNKIKDEFDRIISQDIPINRSTMTIAEAMKYYDDHNYKDKAEVLKYRPENTVHVYECGNYKNYMFGYMLPSTGYIKDYKFRLYSPGFIIQYPRSECGGIIPPFEDAPTFGKALKEANKWGNISEASYIYQMNKIVEEKKAIEFINLCETRHNNMLAELGEKIKQNIDNIRLIAVAGPSSSGKTTFTNRLRIELMSRNIQPLMISIDDYYLPRDKVPLDESGKPDLEHINALDIELFNDNMFKLISGEEVTLPIFNFQIGKRQDGRTVRLNSHQPILIEGIHALNDDLTPSIPLNEKFKIYIAPQAQLHIDDHNPISISDIRLIRRIVRDSQYRNYCARNTIAMWPSVRRGEFKWIYPYQEQADFIFNSELSYELCVFKKYIIPLLEEIKSDDEYFITANRLIKFMKYFKSINDTWIPCNSILREFIGGSMFYAENPE